MQSACGIAKAPGVQGHLDDVGLDLRRWTGVGVLQEKRPSTAQETLPAPGTLLPFKRRAMAHKINTWARGTRQHLGPHDTPRHKVVALILQQTIPDQQIYNTSRRS